MKCRSISAFVSHLPTNHRYNQRQINAKMHMPNHPFWQAKYNINGANQVKRERKSMCERAIWDRSALSLFLAHIPYTWFDGARWIKKFNGHVMYHRYSCQMAYIAIGHANWYSWRIKQKISNIRTETEPTVPVCQHLLYRLCWPQRTLNQAIVCVVTDIRWLRSMRTWKNSINFLSPTKWFERFCRCMNK